ncbi:MAG: 30S ribosomal protein S17 [Candidatus Calescibacterium sp.]|nr:30S ribosomal protein S17 [Candidatus Calescibacterium sp.]MCX7734386.1 30S ribosomal protein S17 [bacterium]MDW8086850.1 30S ribosomal protein S17 [Candidatus Calescibacterium sp.]
MPRKEFFGVVLSAGKMQKTVKVKVETLVKHPKYKKYIKRTKKYLVHDPENRAQVGDKVVIREGRPFSKLKRFFLVKILNEEGPKQ